MTGGPTALSRRALIAGACAAILGVPQMALGAQWVQVTGFATAADAADRDSARRRALADALLSAALAGGAAVTGHSAMSMTRLTSDLLIVRPVGQVHSYRMIAQEFDGQIWRVTIAAQVGPAIAGACPDRRRLVLLAPPPMVQVSAMAPAWADALGQELAALLLDLAARHPSVAQLSRSPARPAAQQTAYARLTQASADAPSGGHLLDLGLRMALDDRDLVLDVQIGLAGTQTDSQTYRHSARVRLPSPSLLGRAAVLAQPDRQRLAAALTRDASAALDQFLDRAGCQPAQGRAELVQDKLTVPLGRVHGLSRASLGFTADPDASTTMLEVVALSDTSAQLAPLDPTLPLAHFAGRPLRFLTLNERLP